jgi:hypothetical protein
MTTRNANLPKPNDTRRESKRAQRQTAATKMLLRTARASAVTMTLSEAAKTSYAKVLARARNHISLKELGVDRVEMRKAVTGAIVIRVPGDRIRSRWSELTSLSTKKSYVTPWPLLRDAKEKKCKWGNRHSHRGARNGMGEMPGSRSQKASPRKESSGGMVLGYSHGHPQALPTVLQMSGAGARKGNMHIGGEQG